MNTSFEPKIQASTQHNSKRENQNTKAYPSRTIVHAKLEMTEPGDHDEQEADAMADTVVSGGKIARKISSGGSSSGIAVSQQMESQLSQLQGGGRPMPQGLLNMMESGFGQDFRQVRLHTDSEAASMSSSIGARAFTLGNDIYFNHGQFSPETTEGQRLVAHELTHVVQGTGKVRRKESSNTPPIVIESFNWHNCTYTFFYLEDESAGKRTYYLERKTGSLSNFDEFWFTFEYNNNSLEFHINKNTQRKLTIATINSNIRYRYNWTPISLKTVRQHRPNITAANPSNIRMPIESSKSFAISQGFNGTFSHNIGALNTNAIDIVPPANTNETIPIVAVGDGIVVKVIKGINTRTDDSNSPIAGGNSVFILHTNRESSLYGYLSIYCHLKNDGSLPTLNATVRLGQRIGTMGNTGFSRGTHLHFSIVQYNVIGSTSYSAIDWNLGNTSLNDMYDSAIANKRGTVNDDGMATWESVTE